MPTREYQCDQCGENSEIFFTSISADHPPFCEVCGAVYGEEFRQIYHAGIGIVKGEPTTFGQQAEQNAKRLGKEQMQKLKEQEQERYYGGKWGRELKPGQTSRDRSPVETPWFRSGKVKGLPKLDKPLNIKKIKDVTKYITTGDKD